MNKTTQNQVPKENLESWMLENQKQNVQTSKQNLPEILIKGRKFVRILKQRVTFYILEKNCQECNRLFSDWRRVGEGQSCQGHLPGINRGLSRNEEKNAFNIFSFEHTVAVEWLESFLFLGPPCQAPDLPEAAWPQRRDHRHFQRRGRGHRVQEHHQQDGGGQKNIKNPLESWK